MKIKLKHNGKELIVEDVEKVSGMKYFTGLMFKGENTGALLFEMTNSAIHSFFCKPFLAVWFNEGKIVDFQLVSPNKSHIKPEKDFDMLLEVPFTPKYSAVVNSFLESSI